MTSISAFGLQTRSMAASPYRASVNGDDDDKYVKCDKLVGVGLRDIKSKDVVAFMRSPFQLYLCFLMAGSVLYYLVGGNMMRADISDIFGYLSTILETLGLLVLQHKIKSQGSAKGISGMSMAMYAISFVSREYLLMPDYTWLIDGWACEILRLPSILIVLDICYSVFITHRCTYQEELDILRVEYVVPACVALAVIIHPHFAEGEWYSLLWTSYLYLDVCSLLPQVVMMARAGSKIEAPIAHFVAATALRWVIDLWFWYFDFDLGPQGWYNGINVSGWLIVGFHILSLCLMADFMYYYIKARLSGSKLSDDLDVGATLDV